jgi:hypothetical protein
MASAAATATSLPSSSKKANPLFFMESWRERGYDWEKIGFEQTDATALNKLVSIFNFLGYPSYTSKLLEGRRLIRNAILTVERNKQSASDITSILNYYTYGDRTVTNNTLKYNLGFDDKPPSNVKVVSLLVDNSSKFIGICYDSCSDTSYIDSPVFSRSPEDKRLVCSKINKIGNVKIAFFLRQSDILKPLAINNPLEFIFYEGGVKFDEEGKYKGFSGNGKLLKKSLHGNGTGYNLFYADFDGSVIIPSQQGADANKLYQYDSAMKLTGYACGNFRWDFDPSSKTDPLSHTSLSKGQNFCLYWGLGRVNIPEDMNDDKASTCSNMYYTVSRRDNVAFNAVVINNLFQYATGKKVGITPDERNVEYIVKEKYTENFPPGFVENCTLYKFRSRVSSDCGGIFCIIEIVVCDSNIKRIRIYKFYTTSKEVDASDVENGIIKGDIKKEGIFIAMYTGQSDKIKSISVVQQCSTGLYGMEYTRGDSIDIHGMTIKKLMPKDISDAMVKKYREIKTKQDASGKNVEVQNVAKLSSSCGLFDESTRKSFKSSIDAAVACYKLFFGDATGDGCVAVLLTQLSNPSGFNSHIELPAVTTAITASVRGAFSTQINVILKDALRDIETDQKRKRVEVESQFFIKDIHSQKPFVPPRKLPGVQEEEEGEQEEQEEDEEEEEGKKYDLFNVSPSGIKREVTVTNVNKNLYQLTFTVRGGTSYKIFSHILGLKLKEFENSKCLLKDQMCWVIMNLSKDQYDIFVTKVLDKSNEWTFTSVTDNMSIKLPGLWFSDDAAAEKAAAEKAAAVAVADAAADADADADAAAAAAVAEEQKLPPGWNRYYSKKQPDRIYYVGPDGKSVWKIPIEIVNQHLRSLRKQQPPQQPRSLMRNQVVGFSDPDSTIQKDLGVEQRNDIDNTILYCSTSGNIFPVKITGPTNDLFTFSFQKIGSKDGLGKLWAFLVSANELKEFNETTTDGKPFNESDRSMTAKITIPIQTVQLFFGDVINLGIEWEIKGHTPPLIIPGFWFSNDHEGNVDAKRTAAQIKSQLSQEISSKGAAAESIRQAAARVGNEQKSVLPVITEPSSRRVAPAVQIELPPKWTSYTMEDNRVYYHHPEHGTQWDPPSYSQDSHSAAGVGNFEVSRNQVNPSTAEARASNLRLAENTLDPSQRVAQRGSQYGGRGTNKHRYQQRGCNTRRRITRKIKGRAVHRGGRKYKNTNKHVRRVRGRGGHSRGNNRRTIKKYHRR